MLDDSTRHLLGDASTRAARYLDGLDSRPVAPSADAIARLAALDVPLPAKAGDPPCSRCACSTSSARPRPWRWPARASSAS